MKPSRRTAYRSYYLQGSSYSNTYKLFWSWTLLELDGLQKINRQEAIRLVNEARNRSQLGGAFAGQADCAIYPFGDEAKRSVDWHKVGYPYIVE